jgi:manganese/zinc/iron transport system ATP- binding protein
MQKTSNIIYVKDLTVVYHEKPVIWDLDAHIPQASMCAILGPNGGGKTTFLKSMLGIIKPVTGSFKIFDEPLNLNKHKIAYVPQRNSVDWTFPVSVHDVVMMGRYAYLSWWQRPTVKDFEIVSWALNQVLMEPYKNRHISQLSGGQQQRVFLARALAQQADIFMLDEPFAGIDIITEQLILKLLKQLQAEGKTIIVVHHDVHTVQQYFDWTLLMNVKHIACGPTKQTLNPLNLQKTFQTSQSFYDSI